MKSEKILMSIKNRLIYNNYSLTKSITDLISILERNTTYSNAVVCKYTTYAENINKCDIYLYSVSEII